MSGVLDTRQVNGVAPVTISTGYPESPEDWAEWEKWAFFEDRALELYRRGWHPIPIGREKDGKPPGKIPWFKGQIGFNGVDAEPYEFSKWPDRIAAMIARGIPGVLNLGIRFPVDVLGIDVDAYDGKRGRETLHALEEQRGPLPPTWRVTSRPYEQGSGIRLYRVPGGWHGPDRIEGDIEFLDRFHRLMAVPPSIHHTGNRYRLHGPDGNVIVPGILPPRTDLPVLP